MNRAFGLGQEEKEQFAAFMRAYGRLYGLRALSYCIMSHHFHILVEALRECWFSRMWDIPSGSMGSTLATTPCGRTATARCWWKAEARPCARWRPTSTSTPSVPGICADPKDYRWCGYAEALAGGKEAGKAVRLLAALDPGGGVLPEKLSRKESLRRWRCHLFGIPHGEAARAEERNKGDMAQTYRQRVPREKALAVLAEGGRLSQAAYLRCRVRYFTDGALKCLSLYK